MWSPPPPSLESPNPQTLGMSSAIGFVFLLIMLALINNNISPASRGVPFHNPLSHPPAADSQSAATAAASSSHNSPGIRYNSS